MAPISYIALLSLFLLIPPSSYALDWDSWRFLLGDWTAEGTGQPGQSSGTFSFNLELQGKILVRRSRADYPAAKDRPAFSHEDLMVIYREGVGLPLRAVYFDNEGHVIHYTAQVSNDQQTVTFLSDAVTSEPRFRLSYSKGENGALAIKFEIAPPGKPESLSTYVEGVARRSQSH